MPMTVRLSARTERAVNALARRRGQTRSDVVRDALEHYTATNGGDDGRGRPYDARNYRKAAILPRGGNTSTTREGVLVSSVSASRRGCYRAQDGGGRDYQSIVN
jgi:hypothetical protein